MKTIPLDPALAERLAAAQLAAPFCGFCRTERAAVEELKVAMGFGAIDECDPVALMSMMPGPAPAEDGPNRQLEVYALAASAAPVGGPGKVHHPLRNIAEWRKGCSCATGHPSACEECTEGLVAAIQKWFHEQVTAAQTQDLATRIVEALLEDEKTEGFDLTAGMFGAAFSALVAELANQQATIEEMGELVDQQAAEITRLKQNINYMTEGCTCKRAEGIPREDV